MKLGDKVELVLGIVIEDNDPKKLGRVKVSAPGYFDREVMSIEAIPWVYPFSMNYCTSFSHMPLGKKVWLLVNNENEEEYWYIPFHELHQHTKDAIGIDASSDVIFSRDLGGGLVQIYQNPGEGLVIKNNGQTVTLDNNGNIIAKTGDATVKISGNNVFLGKDESEWEPLVLGNKLSDLLSQLSSDLTNLSTAAQASPYTATLAESFRTAAQNVTKQIPKIKSQRANVSP